jgi:hypothetical protein
MILVKHVLSDPQHQRGLLSFLGYYWSVSHGFEIVIACFTDVIDTGNACFPGIFESLTPAIHQNNQITLLKNIYFFNNF